MNALAMAVLLNPGDTFDELFAHLTSIDNSAKGNYLACMIASMVAGHGAMPRYLGLAEEDFDALVHHHFPGVEPILFHFYGRTVPGERDDEMADLRALFLAHATAGEPHAGWHATILLSGCMAENHLWQDMGFRSRTDVKGYLNAVFPALAAKNVKDMKWKKFFYKQLCNQEGVYSCRAPSCAVCDDYASCFGPE